MLPIAIFFLVLFVAAFAFAWVADNPGTVTVDWLGSTVELSMVQAIVALGVIVLTVMILWAIVSFILRGPRMFDRWRTGRRRDKGFDALSRGLIAAGAGNVPLARQLTKESGKYLDDEPLVAMLDAQTTLLEGDRMAARKQFAAMMEKDETRVLGLRGLYLEAEREGASEAAAQYALAANEDAPGTPWATKAVLKSHVVTGEWDKALTALQATRGAPGIDKDTFDRHRAVLLTAKAMDAEAADPTTARSDALKAHKLAPSLVPAATAAARACTRLGDTRKASKVLETTWRTNPHPDIADAYVHLRAGDSASDRMKRVDMLEKVKGGTVEGMFIKARMALDAGEYADARKTTQDLLKRAPSERICLLMADIEEADGGDDGRTREWLARAVHAPRDAVWTADGYVTEEWAPISPVSGELDAFEWRVPIEQVGGLAQPVDYASLPQSPSLTPASEEIAPVEAQVAAARDDVEDAVIVEETPKAKKEAAAPAEPAPAPKATEADSTAGFTTAAAVGAAATASTDQAKAAEPQPQSQSQPVEPTAPDAENPTVAETVDAKAAAANAATPQKEEIAPSDDTDDEKPEPKTALKNRDLDPDGDGRLDHAPDDPGVRNSGTGWWQKPAK
ncbi:MAG: heme biosynthesis HemY N-terminal domain-containing protein [Pseudomonadota bacterium]